MRPNRPVHEPLRDDRRAWRSDNANTGSPTVLQQSNCRSGYFASETCLHVHYAHRNSAHAALSRSPPTLAINSRAMIACYNLLTLTITLQGR